MRSAPPGCGSCSLSGCKLGMRWKLVFLKGLGSRGGAEGGLLTPPPPALLGVTGMVRLIDKGDPLD